MSEKALELVRQLKHLPGKHPQKSHAGGRGGGSSGGSAGSAPSGVSPKKWDAVKERMDAGSDMEESMWEGMDELYGSEKTTSLLTKQSKPSEQEVEGIKGMIGYAYEGLDSKPPKVNTFINHMAKVIESEA